ncbi:Ribosomal RNA small subunit methyltransferase H [Gossypium arboreum]|uniref:Ribosomal RNA small subunit methyltransferase H n=1 Tax=Gossypium arboreum TaxID=29729 RepID=A0A0B0PUD3_GOSAR|nr:Ribosomal RNA small subunit methyltransferase H [Gossypium arboreum]
MLSPLGKPLFWATNFFSVVSPYSSTLRFKCGSTNCTDQCCGLVMNDMRIRPGMRTFHGLVGHWNVITVTVGTFMLDSATTAILIVEEDSVEGDYTRVTLASEPLVYFCIMHSYSGKWFIDFFSIQHM